MAPERRGRENIFTHKIGPLAMWVWLLIALALLLGWAYFKNRNASSASSTSPTDTANASQVPQFVNQTYTTVNPPSSSGSGTSTPGQVKVPNVVGMTDAAADSAIKAAGLKVQDTNEPKGGVGKAGKNPGDLVVSQSPEAGAMVARGSSVSVTFASSTKPKASSTASTAQPSPSKPAVHPHARSRAHVRVA